MISIDDNNYHFIKILCDQIFGLENFISTFIWKKPTLQKMISRGSAFNMNIFYFMEKTKNKLSLIKIMIFLMNI